uniref:AfpX18 n=1 Tax=Serratia proteamaculans TaxID=28151 RepID=A0A2R2YZ22_SERPR|nr:glycosyltransferase [Serratia proteamaculans]ANV21616.1 AfpX18 [Serratia proteamaculans]ULG13374.1 hypothetical protein AGR96Xp_00004 [Serratia proteamaculans]ULG17200.1 hypothetical protein 20093p_00114 [Serratia proteamaculans]ULG18088.1 hypothetical protein LCp1_00114 [Serratia proteamaculans]ULG19573.1 hypothetical protein Sprot5p_00082 [Serratia proteamaculans]
MPYASELKKLDKKPTENENFLTNSENETELPAEIPSSFFTESLDEEIEADLAELRAHLQAIISDALPGFYEFQQAGYNLLYPKKVDIEALQARVNTMQIPVLIQPQHKLLEQAANAFLDRFRRFRKESDLHNNALEFIKFRLEVNKAGWDEPQNRDYHQALKHANRLSGYLSGTLDLMSLINENVERQTPWETTRQANYDVLLNELLPVNADAHNNQYAAKTRGNLTGKQPDNIKFNAIVYSVTLDERIAREALSAEIERLSARLLRGITLTRNYAEKPDETGETSGIKRDIDFLCQVLQSVIHDVPYAGQQIQPETYQPLGQKEAHTEIETVKHELKNIWKTARQKVQGAKASGQALSDKFNKNKHRIVHAFPGSTASDKNGDSHNINKAVFQVGIRLLDKIQQTTSDMHKAIQTSRPLQQAVTHYSELGEMLSGMPHNSILDAKLRAESDRWRQKAEESKEQLQQLLGTITTLSDESMKQRYLSALREELNSVTNPLASNNIIRDFDTQIKATVEGLSDIQKALCQALLRLSEHGQAGGKELDKHTVSWLQQLKGIKDNLKTGITQATGQSINNFSREGMLARWMAEWSEAEKQRYLGTLSAEGRAVTEKHYDTVFFEVIQHYLPLLSKESDPQGEGLLQRLRLEVGNAAKGNTLYPATMADILAGMKSREQAIRDWSERKLIRGAFLAVCLGGVKLLPNLAALPLRLPIKFAITGAKVAWGAHKGQQGIRGGEGDISDEIAEYTKQSYKTAAIKIVLSLPPGLATTLGIASIVWDVYEDGLKGAGEKVAKHIIGEAPWRGLDTGTRTVAEAYATTLIEAAITEEKITSATHSSPLQPQTDVMPLSDEHDPGINQPHRIRKRAVADTALRPAPRRSPQWHDNIPSDATLQSGHFDFDRDIRYQDFSGEQKKQTYLHGIQFVLFQIENDGRFSQQIRNHAYLARIGDKLLVPVDIKGHKLNNTIFLPDSRGAKSGVLIRLDSDIPYYYVDEGKDLLENVEWAMPHNANKREPRIVTRLTRVGRMRGFISFPSGVDILNQIRSGKARFGENFNANNPDPMDIASLSARLADTMEADYKLKGQSITNKLLISRAIAGAHISAPDSDITFTEEKYHLEFTWDNLTPAEYLRSFSRPFSTLSGEMQLVTSSIKGETIQETELHVHQAEYIGSWVDATVGAIISFTPAGWVLNTAQSAADIAADLTEGKDPDSLAVAGLVVGCIPGERIAAKVGKFTRIGGKVVKYGVMLGNKAVDLAIVGRSIKTAVDAGEPLAIYQAFLASGMSVKNSYDMARNMSSRLKINRRMEESASLEELEALQNDRPEYATSVPVIRTFRVGLTEMLGRINNGDIEIFNENTSTWEKGSKLHLLAYRLQNAGGGRRLAALFSNKIVIGEHTFKRVKYSQDKFNEMMRIAKTYTPTSNSTERIAKIQQDYRAGKEMSHAPQHDHYNNLSLDEKLNLFNKPDTDAITRGVLAGKINESIANINLYETAKAADDWKASANKATEVVLAPQNIFLKGRAGECLPESVLMGWALQSGQDAKLAKKFMSIYSSSNVADDPLYKSLVELHADGNASKFSAAAISDVKMNALGDAESRLFPKENASVRVDIPEHTMLLSKVNQEGKVKYVFYDPNYGLAYFDKYKDLSAFFKKKLEAYDTPENSTNLYQLDYSHLPDVKIKGRNLNEIINGEIPALYKQERVNLQGISPHEGVYKMPGDKNYIKVNDNVYQVEWDQTMSTWRVFDPANTNRSRVTVPVKRDANGEWFRHLDTGLKGGGLFDEIKNNWLSGKKFKRLQDFTEVVELEANKWPPEPVNKNIHMIWIGTKKISEKNIGLSIETAQKNPDYNTTIIYDSGIPGHESAKSFMAEKFNDSNVTLVDFRNKIYFHQLQKEPAFSYYEQAIRDKKYAQASDILRLLVLKYEGGIYKDIDDVQVKGFGSLAFPKGIGVMREYAPEAGKATAFPNTPIAATKNNSVVNRALELAVENYRRGETNVLKLAGPDVFTEALYQEMPGMRPQVLGQQLEQFELAKRQALGMPLEKPKSFADEQLTLQEKSRISRPYEAIRGLSGYVENGADHSWISDIPGTSALGNSQSEVSATFEPAIFKQALTEFVSQQAAQGPGDPAYTIYQSAFNSLPESQEITLQQVNDLKRALSASGNDLVAQAKYQYALLAYLSGPRGIQLPIDKNEIRNRIVQEIEHADYVYGWKVKEREQFQAQLNKAIERKNEISSRYSVTLRPKMHANADRKVVNLRNEVTERNRLMNEWASKKNQDSLRLDMLNDSWHESYD